MDRDISSSDPEPRLGPRLQAIADRIPPGSRVADVGCDHGRLAEHLIASGRAETCVATEVRSHRLDGFRDRLLASGVPPGLELRVGAGLDPLEPSDRIDVVVLAGMGGDRIRRILDVPRREALHATRFVVQPQTRPGDVRRFLRDAGLRLADERAVREAGRWYVVLVAEPGRETAYRPRADLSETDLLRAGPLLVARGDPQARRYWEEVVARLSAVVAVLPRRDAGHRARGDLAAARRILAALGDDPDGSGRRGAV